LQIAPKSENRHFRDEPSLFANPATTWENRNENHIHIPAQNEERGCWKTAITITMPGEVHCKTGTRNEAVP
jgi:hypothetical protein